MVGDPIEARALGRVLSAGRSAARPCLVGSVKTNIGHLEAGAGIAGLVKVALALYQRRIPGNLLVPGQYFITVAEPLENGADILHHGVLAVTVSEQNNLAARDGRYGVIAPLLEWREEEMA